MTRIHSFAALALAAAPFVAACSTEGAAASRWTGTIDTLPSGEVRIQNTERPVWTPESAWRVVEELRIGAVDGNGPDMFGQISEIEIDPAGRIWVLEGQAQEIRIFGPDGTFVKTVGREGGGPGEFTRAIYLQMGPDGNMWVIDPQNNRISLFDTSGTYLEGRQMPGGFIIQPWPGGFDAAGNYYSPVPLPSDDEGFDMGLVRYDTSFEPQDTLDIPSDPIERERFELHSENSHWITSIPYDGGFEWRLSPAGSLWGMVTDQYRLVEIAPDGDTLRTITRDFTALPVTESDMEAARERLEKFVQRGGKVDFSKIPNSKPATEEFYFDDEGNVWVRPVTTREERGRVFHVFDPQGRFLGMVHTPFALAPYRKPLFRDGTLYGITEDDLEVPYVIRARIEKPDRP
jgi:sugar lactone lactonase YvrE